MASGQERTLHDRALQTWEEAKRALAAKLAGMTEAQEALSRGETNNSAGKAWKEIFEQARPEAQALAARAKELKETYEMVSLSTPSPDYPVYRGRVAGGDGAALPGNVALGANDEGEIDLAALERATDPFAKQEQIVKGQPRVLLNRLLRPEQRGGGRVALQAMSQKERELLTRPRAETLMSPYLDTSGGMITAEEVRTEVLRKARDTTYIRGLARVIATTAASVTFPSFRVSQRLSKTRASEAITPVSLRNVFGKTKFTPSGEATIIKVPEELLEDATFDVLGYLTEEIAANTFEAEEEKFLTGEGGGEALGWLTAIVKLETAGFTNLRFQHSGSAGISFKPDDIKRFPYKLRKGHRANPSCAWMGHREWVETVSIMRDESGGAGTGQYLFRMGMEAGDPDTLVGKPLLESEFFPAPAIGLNNPIAMLANWSKYYIIDRKSLALRYLDQLYAETNEVGYKYERRYDGAPIDSDAAVLLVAKA